MSKSLTILVGTTTGNAQYCADEAAFRAKAADINADVVPMDGLDASVFEPDRTYLLCVSTYGQGDVSDNARGVYETLVKGKPALAGVRYGLVSLGDSSHAQTFCFAGKRFDGILAKLGAERIGEVLNHDASSGTMPEEATAEWAAHWLVLAFGAPGPAA